MLDTAFNKPGSAVDRSLTVLAKRLHQFGVPADALSYAALMTGLVAAALFYRGQWWIGFATVLVSGILDAVDGRVARIGAGPTPWGGVIDLTFDRIVEAAVLLGIAAPRPQWHLPALVLAATWYVNLCVFLAVGAASDKNPQKVIAYPPGLLERSESLIFAFIVVAAPSLAVPAAYVYAALELITASQRLRHGYRALRR